MSCAGELVPIGSVADGGGLNSAGLWLSPLSPASPDYQLHPINFIRTYADERGNPIPRGSDGPASGYRLTECPRMGKDGGESVVSRATRGATG